jgi:Raf kinase inhibitor-like YbhB/YbcL family protein
MDFINKVLYNLGMVKKLINTLVAVFLVILGVVVYAIFTTGDGSGQEEDIVRQIPASNMLLSSSAFTNGGYIPEQYTCDGADISPPLQIEGVPSETKSLLLMVDDPDAPSGSWLHWAVFNIDPSVTDVLEGVKPMGGVQVTNDFGGTTYSGPCPPEGIHHYHFILYALPDVPEFSADVSRSILENKVQSSAIAKAELVGLYQR